MLSLQTILLKVELQFKCKFKTENINWPKNMLYLENYYTLKDYKLLNFNKHILINLSKSSNICFRAREV